MVVEDARRIYFCAGISFYIEPFCIVFPDLVGDLLTQYPSQIHYLIATVYCGSAAPMLHILQEEVKLCNFSSRYLMTDEMKSIDRAMYVFMKQEQIAKKMLLDGDSVERVARLTEVPLYMVRKLKEEMELAEV